MLGRISGALFALTLTSTAALADEVTDALNNASDAYAEGDIQYALEELDLARQLMAAMKTEALVGFLPDAPDGWSREIDTDMTAGLTMLGGGVGAEAEYSDGKQSFTIRMMSDNPMVGAFAAMITNAAMMGAKTERVGREKFMNKDGELSGLIDGRILIQAEGTDVKTMLGLLEQVDFESLAEFGR